MLHLRPQLFETVLESPGYTVPEESGFTWIPGFVPVSETVLDEEGGYLLSLEEPPPLPTSAVTPAVISVITEPVIPMMPPTPDDKRNESGMGSVRQSDRAKVFVVEATEGSTSSAICQDAQDIGPDLTREGPFDACEAEPEPGQSPLVLNSMPGCQFHMTSYDDRDNRDDLDPAYGIHLHDPRMMEYMGAPESARLLGRSPEYWLEHMGRDRAVSEALRLHHDASLIMTNVQVMSQFVTSLNKTASEVMQTCQGAVPDRRGSICDTGAQSSTCGTLHGRHGPVAPYQCSGISWTHLGLLLQLLHGLRGLFSGCSAVMNLLPRDPWEKCIYTNFFVCQFCSFSVQALLVVLYTDLLICNKSYRYIQVFFWVCCVGLGARSVVNFSGGSLLCVEVPVTLFRVYLGMVTSFWSTFVLEGVM